MSASIPDPSLNERFLVVNRRIRIPTSEFIVSYSKSSGPGGQNVNKLNTKALLRWAVTSSPSLPEPEKARFLAKFANRITGEGDFLVVSQRSRDAHSNTRDCLEKLRQMLESIAKAPVARRPTKPSKASKERRLAGKRAQSAKKQMRRTKLDE
ncbi:MAG: alternative ribosome rescue aminoacyl-tRNA hydrolase ArfB [Planctomycetota bacterium]